MAAAVATATAGLLARIESVRGYLKSKNIERDEDIDLLLLAVLSGEDILFLGEPGVGKTYFIELLTKRCFKDMVLYTHLLAKDQSADELLGPRDIVGYKEGKVRRLTAGYAPDSHVAYWDEVFKASPPMLNPALGLSANRVLKMGGEVKDCSQLITIVMSSNELPEREDLVAFRDRITITKKVEPIRTDEGRRALIDLQLDGQDDAALSFDEPLTLDEVQALRAEVEALEFPHTVREKLTEAWRQWAEHRHSPSGRRIGSMQKVMKASAYLAGRDKVNADDLLVCQHMAWNRPDDAETALSVVIALAEAFTRKAEEIRQAQEPLMDGINDLRAKAKDADTDDDREELQDKGFEVTRDMKRLIRRAEKMVEEGREQDEDVSRLEAVIAEIQRQHDWAEDAVSFTDDK